MNRLKPVEIALIFGVVVALLAGRGIAAQQEELADTMIRLHVIANSDSETDQSVKLQVRDAITESLQEGMARAMDAEQAKTYLREHLSQLEDLTNETLQALGSSEHGIVQLVKEYFPTRHYETFSLPAGIYDSLKVTIGAGEGKNWWCVVFPELCIPATMSGVEDVAEAGGFPEELTGALTGEPQYKIRFFFLDCLGRLEKLLQRG